MEYTEPNGLCEIFLKVDTLPIADETKPKVKGLLQEHGLYKGLWDQNTVQTLDRIITIVGYRIADMETFGYTSEEDWEAVGDAFRYIRGNLGKILQ